MTSPGDTMNADELYPRSITLYNNLIAAIEKRASIATVCRMYALYVLACHAGNKSRTAEVLEIDRRTLHRWEKERREGNN